MGTSGCVIVELERYRGNGEVGKGERLAVSGTWEVVWPRNRGRGLFEDWRESGEGQL
ncbi:hypothetical protein Tco_0292975, partial [Tanacetum coccineum]